MPKGPLTPDERQACMAAIVDGLHATITGLIKRYLGRITETDLKLLAMEATIAYLEARLRTAESTPET